MGKFMLLAGLGLMLLPVFVFGLEYLIALFTHPTGEAAMAVGFWAVWTAFLTVVPGFIIFVIGLIVWMIQR